MSFVGEMVDLVGADLHKYAVPHGAEGKCLAATRLIGEIVHWDGVEMIFTRRDGRDHCAAYIREEGKVLDYTMRQFHPETAFPFIGTLAEWESMICAAWRVSHIGVYAGKPCDECNYLEALCKCCEYCSEAFCVCD